MYFQVTNSNLRLAGAMHRFPEGRPQLPEWLSDAYSWCDDVVFECDVSDQTPLLTQMNLPAGDSLRAHLPLRLWDNLSAVVNTASDPLRNWKPWALMISLPTVLVGTTELGVEQQLIPRSRQERKDVHFLETGVAIAEALDSLPDAVCAEAIAFMLRHRTTARDAFNEMFAALLGRDLEGAHAIDLRVGFARFPAVTRQLGAARNRAWLPQLETYAESRRRTVVMVGAMHLIGSMSLPAMLAARGYNVQLMP